MRSEPYFRSLKLTKPTYSQQESPLKRRRSEDREGFDSYGRGVPTDDNPLYPPRISHAGQVDHVDANGTLKKLLKYCQEVVTKKDDSNDNLMDKAIFFGQDFKDIGLIETDSDDWFCVDENGGGTSSDILSTNQRQLFYDLFDYQRRSKIDGGEIICGIGIARQYIVDDADNWRRVWHPVILVHLDIRESNGHIWVSPNRIHSPALWSMAPLCAGDETRQDTVRELEERFQKHLQMLDSRNTQLSPFDPSTYTEFLNHFRRCWHGESKTVYDSPMQPPNSMSDSEKERAVERYWQDLKRRQLQIVNEWVIYTQAGDLSTCKKDIQGFIGQFELRDCRPPPWACYLARMFECIETAALEVATSPIAGEREWLFPLASNKQQQEIAELLVQHHTVVVQGPPGTGKTHTLANLVSDAVARGRRVLVVSTGQHALEVFLEKLPASIKNVAMFFGDGGQSQDQSQVIRAVENVRKVMDESRRAEWIAQAIADKEHIQELLEEFRNRKKIIEAKLQRRAELLLLPLAKPLSEVRSREQSELKAACELRKAIHDKFGQTSLKRKNLLYLVMAVCKDKNGSELNSGFDEISVPDLTELVAFISDLIQLLPAIFQPDLYKELQQNQRKLLEFTEKLTTLQLKEHIIASNEKFPAVSILANQFLEQLRAGQGRGRGHQARHWKSARQILVRQQGLVEAFPLWIMTTSMVSELLPPKFSLFDIVAIDEASKSEIFELPALLRGEKLLVIGDNKQVSPNDLTINECRLHELDRLRTIVTSSVALQCSFAPGKSIFDLFYGVHVDKVKILREHFRCTQAIIDFCNENFYGGELEPLRVSTRAKRLIPSILCNERDVATGAEHGSDVLSSEEVEQRLMQLQERLLPMKNEQLKEECRVHLCNFFRPSLRTNLHPLQGRKQHVSGSKQVLIERIMEHERGLVSGKSRARGAGHSSKVELDDLMINEVTVVI
jgi:hypothetical protein